MPEYLYECPKHGEFETTHSIMIKLEVCPKCVEEGVDPPNEVKRLINCMTKGVVELTGNELTAKVREDANQMQREMYSSEKKYSNMLGEGHYQQLQQRIDYSKRNRGDY
jgi:hypothetical protein